MAKPKTRTRTVKRGDSLTILVTGQNDVAKCSAVAVEEIEKKATSTTWAPSDLAAGVAFKVKGPSAIVFVPVFFDKGAPVLKVIVSGGAKPPQAWEMSINDEEPRMWQLWVLVI